MGEAYSSARCAIALLLVCVSGPSPAQPIGAPGQPPPEVPPSVAPAVAPGMSAIDAGTPAPTPLLADGSPADWFFAFKFNAGKFPSSEDIAARPCPFGGTAQSYSFSQRYLSASSSAPTLLEGQGLIGTSAGDPLGATFARIYAGAYHYVVWNDQLYRHPAISGCGDSCGAPWGHSKGVVAWNDAGEGVVLQVTTPSWPAAASAAHPRDGDGNTLGCVDDNDVKVSQDFFALRLTEPDLEQVLNALANASVVTDIANPELVSNGGPPAVQALVATLGTRSASTAPVMATLSTGVRLIGKPSKLDVPPWQFVSAMLGGIDLRAATWWTTPAIPSTTAATRVGCWSPDLPKPGAVQIATSGVWRGQTFSLKGGPAADGNHAKVGVSLSGSASYTIFGDMNQQGALSGKCASSQNGRGGLFFVVDNAALHDAVEALIAGDTAPTTIVRAKRKASIHHVRRARRRATHG